MIWVPVTPDFERWFSPMRAGEFRRDSPFRQAKNIERKNRKKERTRFSPSFASEIWRNFSPTRPDRGLPQ
jgi:hypothetical protein